MNFIQNAGKYVIRKRNRSTLLVLLLTTVFVLILTVASIAAHAMTTVEQMKKTFSREFIVNAYNAPGVLTLDKITEISARDDIAAYRLISNTVPVELADHKGTPLSVKTDGSGCLVSPGFEHAGTLVSNITSDSDQLFSEGTLTLLSGRHIAQNDKGKILIHRELADKNSLRIGDILQMKFSQPLMEDIENMGYDTSHMNTSIIQAEITGIFDSHGNDNENGMHLSHQLYENYCYIDLTAFSSVFNPASPPFFCQTAFSIASSRDLAVVTEAVKNLDWPAGQPESIVSDLDDYAPIIESLASLANSLKIILLAIILVCIILLHFLLSHEVKQRRQEIGIMMSLGLTRGRILTQHITEVWVIALTAAIIAFPISGGIVYKTAELIGGRPAFVSQEGIEVLLILGLLLLPASVITAEYPVLQKKPTENLQSIS